MVGSLLYRRKLNETESWTWWIDAVAVYLATDLSACVLDDELAAELSMVRRERFLRTARFCRRRSVPDLRSGSWNVLCEIYLPLLFDRFLNPGKDIVVATTAVCWYVGIVLFNSDYAFTVTNVIIHGVPYFALIWFYVKARRESTGPVYRTFASNWIVFLATLWALAYVEELFWSRGVWHERDWLFGSNWDWTEWKVYLVPLLAVPQLTHYILDGFIWRRKKNPRVDTLTRTRSAEPSKDLISAVSDLKTKNSSRESEIRIHRRRIGVGGTAN